MTNLLEQGVQFLADQRRAHMATQIVYERGADSVSITDATVGKTTFEQEDQFGHLLRFETRDYIFDTDQLIIGGVRSLPKKGDRIHEQVGVQLFVYEVLSPGGEPPWRYSDPYRKQIRVHTKHISTE